MCKDSEKVCILHGKQSMEPNVHISEKIATFTATLFTSANHQTIENLSDHFYRDICPVNPVIRAGENARSQTKGAKENPKA